jgi:DNA-binding NarL/FixJ family response regulator
MKKIFAMLVDDNKIFRESFRILLRNYPNIEIIAEAENGRQALDLLDQVVPDVVFMDIQMPELNGIEATKLMLSRNINIKFIATTMFRDKAYLTSLIYAGFKGCVFKDNIADDLNNALDTVLRDEYFFPENIKPY